MKKTILTLTAILLSGGSIFLSSCSSDKSDIPALADNEKISGPAEEQAKIKSTYDETVTAIKKNPDNLQPYITLASVYISEGRITGDNNYYSNAAMKMLDKVTETNTANKDIMFQALSLKSTILLNMHQFKDALSVAQQGVAINSYNSGIFGALVDANVEMGNYDEAVKDCDKMISIRPDLRSYSRASYLRQIYGQNTGAIEAMKMALDAGLAGAENTEWVRTTLGDLYLNNGNLDSASILYRTSLVYRPDYPFAIIGMARVEKARKNYTGAIDYTKKAIGIRSESAFVSLLADLYQLQGEAEKAQKTHKDVVRLLEEGQKEEAKDAPVKHNVNRELAMAYLDADNTAKALEYAQKDLAMRPGNIDANELTGWIYYRMKDYANAKPYADKMMTTHSRNANTLYKAGAIYASAGDAIKGNQLMHEATVVNPYIDQLLVLQTNPQPAVVKK